MKWLKKALRFAWAALSSKPVTYALEKEVERRVKPPAKP